MTRPVLDKEAVCEAQALPLTGYDFDRAQHFVLRIADPARARQFIGRLVREGVLSFGDYLRDPPVAVNLGFSFRGLKALGLPTEYLDEIGVKSPAFAEGAPVRAALRLGDAGRSAVEHWEEAFASLHAHAWLVVHADTREEIERMVRRLRDDFAGEIAFGGWTSPSLRAAHFKPRDRNEAGRKIDPRRRVHFGFEDNIARPFVRMAPGSRPNGNSRFHDHAHQQAHAPGELLLGHENDSRFNLWSESNTRGDVAQFARNASFGILRKIEQDERWFREYLADQARELSQPPFAPVDEEYLKAKMCGRWTNGSLIAPTPGPGHALPGKDSFEPPMLDTRADTAGLGCPFGAHIRRTNPRGDPVAPHRERTLFRRGIPYGRPYDEEPDHSDRGLMGVFFCGSIEDQFEGIVSEWVEKNPMGPPNPGRAKDPLIGNHDDPTARFYIPTGKGKSITIDRFRPFVRTRGTLYALFPGRWAMARLGEGVPQPANRAWSAPPPERDPGPGRVPGDPPPSESAPVTDKLRLDDAPADRFCDLVMEGGVTSGIIYATAVAKLAGHYRFRSIGGSSIGAFAAALAAAAEYRRRRGSTAGFDMLRGLPSELADNKADGRTLLERLFQPQPGTRRLFQVFRAGLGRRSFLSKLASVGRSLLRQYRVVVAVAVIVLILLPTIPGLLGWMQVCSLWSVFATECAGWTTAWLFMGLPALVEVVVFALLAGLGWDLVRGLVSNGYGLCRGWGRDHTIFKPTDHGPVPDLAGFLHGAIQKAAGRDPLDDLPLTFEDLWMAPGGPTEMLDYKATGAGARSIDLQVYASNLAQNRPYRFPLDLHPHGSEGEDDDMGRLYFKPDELADYFPRGIVDYMTAVSSPYRRRSGQDPPEDAPSTTGCRELPVERLPIVVAARLAMSFPFLVSAIPLWAIRHPPKEKGQRLMHRCWMSDGGLCSNFPIHLFDGWIPKWPTFGISLLKRPSESEGPDVWLPDCYREGRADTWNGSLGAEATGPAALWGFISSLFVTIWRWNDATTMRMPGVRDRVVRVYLDEEEGGVNIRMTPEEIDNLAQRYGEKAADVLIERFARPASRGWNEHRWIRFNTLLLALRERVQGLRVASEEEHHAVPLREQIELAVHQAPLQCSHHPPGHGPADDPITPEEAVDLQVLLHHLLALEAAFARRGQKIPFDAIPFPSLRIRHPT